MEDAPQQLHLRATLEGSDPEIWRTFEVPEDLTLGELHDTLQILFGWENQHLFHFEIAKKRYGTDETYGEQLADEHALADVVKVRSRFTYLYDFGDSWEVELRVEARRPAKEGDPPVRCTGGARAGPLEDSGGVRGYQEKLAARENPEHPDHEEVLEWLPEDLDPEAFDLAEVNDELEGFFPLPLQSQAPGTAHVTRIGPLTSKEGEHWLYLGLDEERSVISEQADGAKALAELKGKLAGKLYCDPSLAKVGEPLGYESARITLEAAALKATIAWQLSAGQRTATVHPGIVIPLLNASTAFMAVEPWEDLRNQDVMEVTFERGGKTKTAELSVMGAAGREYGIVLYEKPGALERVGRAMESNDAQRAALENCISITLDEAADWLVDAFDPIAPCRIEPVPIKLHNGQPQPISADELSELTAVMLMVADGKVGAREPTEVVTANGGTMSVRIAEPRPIDKPKKKKKWSVRR